MYDAHCICPKMIANYVSERSFYNYLTCSDSQIILDSESYLIYEYFKAIGREDESKFKLLKCIFQFLENMENKILKVNSEISGDVKKLMLDITIRANTTFNRSFLVFHNDEYSEFLTELRAQNIQLFNYSNLDSLLNGTPNQLSGPLLNYNQLMEDLEFSLFKLMRTKVTGRTEDELNDYIRDILEAKRYTLRDQTREGASTSGNSSGELDLVILDGMKLYTIIEAMKLSSVDQGYISTHYKKLLVNYNPLGVRKSFLVSYYTGQDFLAFSQRYEDYIRSIDPVIFECDDLILGDFEEKDSGYANIKKFIHNITLMGYPVFCTHYILKI